MNNKKLIGLTVLSIVITIIATIGVTYSYLSFSSNQTTTNVLSSPCFNITFEPSSGSNINLTNAYPMSDAKGLTTKPYSFTITNTCEVKADYTVVLNVLNTTDNDLLNLIDYSLDSTNFALVTSLKTFTYPSYSSKPTGIANSYVLATGNLDGRGASKTYNLQLWIDDAGTTAIVGQSFYSQIYVYSEAK